MLPLKVTCRSSLWHIAITCDILPLELTFFVFFLWHATWSVMLMPFLPCFCSVCVTLPFVFTHWHNAIWYITCHCFTCHVVAWPDMLHLDVTHWHLVWHDATWCDTKTLHDKLLIGVTNCHLVWHWDFAWHTAFWCHMLPIGVTSCQLVWHWHFAWHVAIWYVMSPIGVTCCYLVWHRHIV